MQTKKTEIAVRDVTPLLSRAQIVSFISRVEVYRLYFRNTYNRRLERRARSRVHFLRITDAKVSKWKTIADKLISLSRCLQRSVSFISPSSPTTIPIPSFGSSRFPYLRQFDVT